MADEREDPIEAIKRRNEERARRLKERIASGEFDKFETRLEAVDEDLPGGPEALEAPESEFDLSSFPAPPEPAGISLDEPPAASPAAEPPAFEPPAVEAPVTEPPAAELLSAEPPAAAAAETVPMAEGPAIPPPGAGDVLAALDLTDLDLEGAGEVLAPQAWDGAEAAPAAVTAEEAPPAPPAEETAPPAFEAPVELPPELEIEVEAPPAPVEAAPAPAFEGPPVEAGPPSAEVTPPPFEEVGVAAGDSLGEEEAEAIKATIDEELREVGPPAPPMPRRREEVPAAAAVETPVAPKAEEVIAPAAPAPEAAEITINIEVRGNKVRIERRNIKLADVIELFQSIVDRYENR